MAKKSSDAVLYAVLALILVSVLGWLWYKAHHGTAAAVAQLQAGVLASQNSVPLYTPSLQSTLLPEPNAPL